MAKGIVTKVLKTVEGDGGQQWVVDDYDNIAPQVLSADATFGSSGYKTIAVAVSINDGPMKYAGTLPIMDPPRSDTAVTIKKIKVCPCIPTTCQMPHDCSTALLLCVPSPRRPCPSPPPLPLVPATLSST